MLHPPRPATPPAALDPPARDATLPPASPAAWALGAEGADASVPGVPRRLPRYWWVRGPAGVALALLLPAAATLAARALGPLAGAAMGVYVVGVIVAAMVGGAAPGLLATALSLPLAAYSVLPPIGSWAIATPQDRVRLVLVAAISVLASVLVGALARARARADRAAADAERLAAELRARVHELQHERSESRERAERLARATGEYEIATRELSGARADRAAADAERRRIARLLESVTDGFCTLDAGCRVTFANDALLAMWRRGRGDLVGRALAELVPAREAAVVHAHVARTLREHVATECEYHDPALDVHFGVKAVPFEDGASVVLRDISARVRAEEEVRASEARYRALSEAGTRLVWSAAADGRVDDMPVWRALTGQSPEAVRGDGWTRAIHDGDRARVLGAWRRAVRERATFQDDFRVALHDGTHRWYRARAVPVLDAGGAVREWVGVLEEVDAERRTEEARTFLERASEALAASLDVHGTLHAVVRLAVDGALPFADLARVDLPDGVGGFACLAFESRDAELARAYREMEAAHPVPPTRPPASPTSSPPARRS